MKLTDEERNSLVILQLEKAKVFLKQADEMFDLKYWDIASNRYYYACFHAVQALLIQNGLSCKTCQVRASRQTPLHSVLTAPALA